MRITHFMAAVLVGAIVVTPACAQAQVSVNVTLGAELGPPVPVFGYSAERYGRPSFCTK
jgi:hypothetical protein